MPRTRKHAWIVAAVAAVAALPIAAVPATASSSLNVVVSGPNATDAADQSAPRAKYSSKLESCVESAAYSDRQVGIYASMRPYKRTKRMQMRFQLLRAYPGQSYKRVTGLGLGDWVGVSPKASVAIRHMIISGVDTAATYRGRVDFRWRGKTRRWTTKRTAFTSRTCQLVTPAPDLQVVVFRIVNTIGTVSTYQVDIANNGGSEARSVALDLSVDGKSVATRSIESMLLGATASYQLSAATCKTGAKLVLDPGGLVHEAEELNNSAEIGCP